MKLDRRILSPLFIGVDIDLRYFITVLLSVHVRIYHCYLLFMKHNLYKSHVECKQNVVLFSLYVRLNFGKKKNHASGICKRFLFPESNDPPKITTPLKLRPPKAANSESNEGRYYRNSTVFTSEQLGKNGVAVCIGGK